MSNAKKDKYVTFRVNYPTWKRMETVGQYSLLSRGDYARRAAVEDLALFNNTSYYCKKSEHFLYVDQDGTFHLWRRKLMVLTKSNMTIRSRLKMKHKKIHYYLDEFRKNREQYRDSGEFLKSQWQNARCQIRSIGDDGVTVGREYLSGDKQYDLYGITDKNWEFEPSDLGGGCHIQIETCVKIHDYAQWFDSSKDGKRWVHDEFNLDILTPTLDTRIMVLVDQRLYRDTLVSGLKVTPKQTKLTFSLRMLNGDKIDDKYYNEWGIVRFPLQVRDPNRCDFEPSASGAEPDGAKRGQARDPSSFPNPEPVYQSFKSSLETFMGSQLPPTDNVSAYSLYAPRARQGLRFTFQWLKPDRPDVRLSEDT